MRWLAAMGASDVLVGLGLVGVVSAVGAGVLARRLDARPAEFGVRIERRVELTASDGVRLAADLYHPDTAGRRPTILVRIPYAKKPSHMLFAATVGRLWAARGYTVMIQGTRGRYDSGGRHHPFRREREDGIDLWPTSMLFRRGHRLRLEVSSSNFPRFDRNPNTGRPIATETETREATQTVHHGLRTPSRLVLPVVPAEGPR